MNLYSMLQRRKAMEGPIRVGVIGAGKFSSMFLTQAVHSDGFHVVAVADINVPKAKAALDRTGWPTERFAASSFDEALRTGGTYVLESADELIERPEIEVVLEITGNPIFGTYHAIKAIDSGKHVIMVNVEADCMVGPILQRRAQQAGVVYSMAYGDQPALICELVDWCRTVGFDVVAAGKGTKYLPEYNYSTPTPCGTTTGSPTNNSLRETTTRRCSTPSLTGLSQPSRWLPSRTAQGSCRRMRGCSSLPQARTTSRPCSARAA